MHLLSARACCISFQNQPVCMISRLTCFSFAVVVIFTVCVIHEFTFILHYPASRGDSPLRQIGQSRRQKQDDWLKVTDTVYVYSAFWDTRLPNESFVRIIGGAKSPGNDLKLTKCLLKVDRNSTVFEVPVNYEILTEHHNMPSKAVYIKCAPPFDEFPTFAAVVPDSWSFEPEWLVVKKLQSYTLPDIGVCVRPMFNLSDVFRISEFIAYYEALGVSRFTFYDYDASEEVIEYLHELKRENYAIDVLPWSLPNSLKSMWSVGQMASINDCLYRSMKEVMYVVVVDLDEFVTPRHVVTLQELLHTQDIPSKQSASFILRSCVFCPEYKQDTLPPVILPFKTQNNIRRENFFYPFLIRSKYIVKPHAVQVAGIHHVWRTLSGWEERFVPVSQVLVHHYRENLCNNETLGKGEIDVKARKYLNPLMRSKAVKVWKDFFSH